MKPDRRKECSNECMLSFWNYEDGLFMQSKTVDIPGRGREVLSPPVNSNANPPGHDKQEVAAASAAGAVAASASRVGTAAVDNTDSAVRLSSPSLVRGQPIDLASDSVSEQTIEIKGVVLDIKGTLL